MPFVVQFPHPGREHRPAHDEMQWNSGDHGRKFLRAHATYLQHDEVRQGLVGFWGEYEPPSRVVQRWDRDDKRLPRLMHDPLPVPAGLAGKRQNTDPLVFGPNFLYTNCRQSRQDRLRRLSPGSVVLFGSGQGHGFVLDTVFVVGQDPALNFNIGDVGVLEDAPLAEEVVFGPLATNEKHLGHPCVAYRGQMWTPGAGGPFSFVPCSAAEGAGVRFPRPVLRPEGPLAGLTDGTVRMAARIREVDLSTAEELWHEVRAQVLAERLSLGVRLDLPGHA